MRLITVKSIKIKFSTFIFILTMLLSVLIFTTVSLIMYGTTDAFVQNKLIDTQYSNFLQISKKIEIYIDGYSNILETITTDGNLLSGIEQAEKMTDLFEKVQKYMQVENTLNIAKKYSEGVESLLLLTRERVFASDESTEWEYDYARLIESEVLKNAPEKGLKPVMIHFDGAAGSFSIKNKYSGKNLLEEGDTAILGVMKKSGSILGIVILKINDSWICSLMPSDMNTYILSGEKLIWNNSAYPLKNEEIRDISPYLHNRTEGVVEIDRKGVTAILYKRMSSSGGHMIQLVQERSRQHRLTQFSLYLLLAILLSIITSLLMSGVLLGRTLRPFYSIVKGTERFMTGDSVENILVKSIDSKYSIRERIMFFFTIVILVPLLIYSGLYYFFSSQLIREEILESKRAAFIRSAENIEIMLDRKIKAIRTLSFDSKLQDYLAGRNRTEHNESLENIVSGYIPLLGQYYNFSVYSRDSRYLYSLLSNKENRQHQNVLETLKGKDFVNFIISPGRSGSGSDILSLTMKTSDIGRQRTPKDSFLGNLGYIVIDMEEAQLSDFFRDLAVREEADIWIENPEEKRVLPRENNVIKQVEEGRAAEDTGLISGAITQNIVFSQSIRNTDWTMKGNYSYAVIDRDIKSFFYNKIYILFIVVLLLLVISFETAYHVTAFIDRICKLLRQVKLENVNIEFPQESFIAEIDELGKTFNDMVQRIDSLVDDLIASKTMHYSLEQQKRDVEIIALQSQIKPHFLCNTLDSIRCLVGENETKSAMDMLKQLSSLFRYGISKQETIISVEQEIAYAKAYTAIMGKRFMNKIHFVWEIAEGISQYPTLKMLLQPLIENAIEHGILPKKSGGTVKIRCFSAEKALVFKVADNGVGMDAYQLEGLAQYMDHKDGSKIGLCNVKKRLDLYYEGRAMMDIASSKGEGTEISIRIPVE